MFGNNEYLYSFGAAFTRRPRWLTAFAPRPCVSVLALLLVGLALPARATNVTVGCAGAVGAFDFNSLGAALAALGPPPNTITVSGTCTEFVQVEGLRRLTIIGTPGAALVDPGAPDTSSLDAVLTIAGSRRVQVVGLTIQVASRSIETQIAVVAVEGSTLVTFAGCKLEGAGPSDGIDIFGPSSVTVTGATVIENNNDGQGNGEGIFVGGGSPLNVAMPPGVTANCPAIQGNGDNGIFVGGGGSVTVRRCATIQNNGGAGISAAGGTVAIREPQATPGAIRIQGNIIGIHVTNDGRLSIAGPALIQGNTSDGVRLRAAAGTIGGFPAGPTIQQNGAGPFVCCALFAGISVAQNSQLDLFAGLVTSNFAPGLLVQDNSSVRIANPTLRITNNPVGVAVTNLSTAGLFLGPVLSGNTGPDLSCSPDSVAYGDGSGVGRINCPGFRVQPLPGAPVPPPKSPL